MSRLPILFILLTVVLDSIGIGLIFPVMPDLLREVTGADLSHAAIWGGVLATSFAVMQFLFGPIVGNLSDAYGRRPILLIALGAMALDYMLMAVAGTIWLLLIGRLIAGVTAATHSTAAAFMADISAPDERAKNFGLIGAAFGVGFVAGPMIGGLMAGIDTRAPFYAAAALSLGNMIFGYFVMPETVTDRIRRPFSWARANPLNSFRAIGNLPGLGRLLIVFGIYQVAFFVYPAVWAFFGAERFEWGTQMIGVTLTVFGLCMALTQALLVGPAIRLIGARRTVVWGMLLDLVVFTAYGFLTNGMVVLIFIPISALGGIVMPAMQGIMSRKVPDDQQGELQGVMASVAALSMIISPMLMTSVFSNFTRDGAPIYLPGAPFYLAGALLAVALMVFLASPARVRPEIDA
ncbi:MAG: DHA1 family tetracycline resistance protein-like MFS transporter [Halocynthiibacter sp.]|jgi:DHA1 family tetracycline resistance protein-like MFS transporter